MQVFIYVAVISPDGGKVVSAEQSVEMERACGKEVESFVC